MNKTCDNINIDFNFPFKAYSIQIDFMKSLYKTLEEKKIGIFESPTGTGKSLSIICSSLKWLKDFKTNNIKELETVINKERPLEVDDFIENFQNQNVHELSVKDSKEKYQCYKKLEEKKIKIKQRRKKLEYVSFEERPLKKHKLEPEEMLKELQQILNKDKKDEDAEFIVENYESDTEASENYDTEPKNENNILPKIIYCSRTHSQLAQFVNEVKKTSFAKDLTVVTLGSRKNLCVNESILLLKNISHINDRCLELHKNVNDKKGKGCPFYKKQLVEDLQDNILAEIKDIEEIVTEGRKTKTCPYYASRKAVEHAELIVMPYNTLLHKDTRDSCGINLKESVIIIDEAHNLLESIANIHGCTINGLQLRTSYLQLKCYLSRYHSRMNAKNISYIRQLLFILNKIVKYLGGTVEEGVLQIKFTKDSIIEAHNETLNSFEFFTKMGIENINLFKLVNYCKVSKISQKVNGLTKSVAKKASANPSLNYNNPEQENSTCYLIHLEEFLSVLSNSSNDGRIIISKMRDYREATIKYILLNPSDKFQSILQSCHSLILAGGTMEPISEYVEQLFKPAGIEHIEHFSCDHIVPPQNLCVIAATHGPSKQIYDYSYQTRKQPQMLEELNRTLKNLSNIIPGGIVVFVPSYEYEKLVYSHWESSGFIKILKGKKPIFREPRSTDQMAKVLNDYSKAIYSPESKGAILLSVVGGKMSEGINFSDDLGRCVVMVGLPYANIYSPELKEKMSYIDRLYPKLADGRKPSQEYYKNLCMKAVNQSIGRAIRHQNDYATILLLDHRFQNTSIINGLPNWIRSSLKVHSNFGDGFCSINKFFKQKKINLTQFK